MKALGNAVVPAQAALAWRVLWARMERTIAQEMAREKSAQKATGKPQKSLKSPRRKKAA